MVEASRHSVLVVGIGTELRGDDAAGLLAVRLLNVRGVPDGVSLLECPDGGLRLMDCWSGYDTCILIDAVSAGCLPGTILTLDLKEQRAPLPLLHSSSHHLGLAETIELGRAMDVLPDTLLLYGIEGASYRAGAELSPEVAAAVDSAVGTVREHLLHICSTRGAMKPFPPRDVSNNKGPTTNKEYRDGITQRQSAGCISGKRD